MDSLHHNSILSIAFLTGYLCAGLNPAANSEAAETIQSAVSTKSKPRTTKSTSEKSISETEQGQRYDTVTGTFAPVSGPLSPPPMFLVISFYFYVMILCGYFMD
jgi:hypothetical protein